MEEKFDINDVVIYHKTICVVVAILKTKSILDNYCDIKYDLQRVTSDYKFEQIDECEIGCISEKNISDIQNYVNAITADKKEIEELESKMRKLEESMQEGDVL